MKRVFLTSAFLLGLAGVASAADMPVVEAPPVPIEVAPPIFSWTGGYFGVQTGYLWGDGSFGVQGLPGLSADGSIDGWLGGIYAGYNYQFTNNVVLGVDGDIAWTNADGFGEAALNGVTGPLDAGVDYQLNWTGALRMKAGYAMDRFLPYIAGGLAFGSVDATRFTAAGVTAASADDTMVGWTIGAGLEYAFTDALIGRFEYRYTDFGNFDMSDGLAAGEVGVTTNDVRVGLAYKF